MPLGGVAHPGLVALTSTLQAEVEVIHQHLAPPLALRTVGRIVPRYHHPESLASSRHGNLELVALSQLYRVESI